MPINKISPLTKIFYMMSCIAVGFGVGLLILFYQEVLSNDQESNDQVSKIILIEKSFLS